MDFEIQPYVGVGHIRFGMQREKIHKIIDSKVKVCQKGPSNSVPISYFIDLGVQVFFDEKDSCEAVEFSLPSDPIFRKQHLLKRLSVEKLKLWFETTGANAILYDQGIGFTVPDFGIGIYTESYNYLKGKRPKAVLVYKEGYYDDMVISP